ncbi:fasciclin domain-containing protein [Sedimentitalea sp. HM32M-2]|uniref:fasciclin domain-containing protein n=1 Tax=Sedimentitalea sp. HM32M-2 TaxID=3351566 RepID=UPI00362E1E40
MDRRLVLKSIAAAAALGTLGACAAPQPDIVDIAASDPNFSTLVTALKAADLVDDLQGAGPLTVLAPTNAAFDRLPAGTVDSLLQPENKDRLRSVLTYHVLPGRVTSDQILGQKFTAKTLQGQTVAIDGRAGKHGTGVRVNSANVTQADIDARNGVIHVIDRVLLPR